MEGGSKIKGQAEPWGPKKQGSCKYQDNLIKLLFLRAGRTGRVFQGDHQGESRTEKIASV